MQVLLELIYHIFNLGINIYTWVMIIYFLLTWFPAAYNTKLFEIMASIVEPYLNVFRKLIPSFGGISFAGIFAILALRLIQDLVNYVLIALM